MHSGSSTPPDPIQPVPALRSRPSDRAIVVLVVGLVLLYALWMLRTPTPPSSTFPVNMSPHNALVPENVPLVTGDEPLVEIFTKAGCPVCHTIPGVPGAHGQVGPMLVLGTTGEQRLQDPSYNGEARTVREYIVESVLDPRRFVVPGYPDRTMPTWYGSKLSALALEKMAAYLGQQTGEESVR